MNTSNPRFWALFGFVVGLLLAAGGINRTPLDALLGGLIQSAIWFGVSSLIIKRKKYKTASEENSEPSLARKIVGGFLFFTGFISLLNSFWGADGASFGPALFFLAIGIPTFWPVLKKWFNQIPFSK